VVRFFILRAHYRSPLSYSDAHLDDAKQSLNRLYTALKGTSNQSVPLTWTEGYARRFKEAMDDDFGTPEAVAVLFDLANRVNSGEKQLAGQLRALGGVLGILQGDPVAFLQGHPSTLRMSGTHATELIPPGFSKSVEQLIRDRINARSRKDFAEADRIRRQLADAGVILEDGPQGTTWRRE
jgi:cysteinyl-tRNA synthetase